MNSPSAIAIKEGVRRRYGGAFLALVEGMLARRPEARSRLDELDLSGVQAYSEEEIEEKFEPDVELLLRDFRSKVRFKGKSMSSFLESFGMKPGTCQIKDSNLWDAMEEAGLKVGEREREALLKNLDPSMSGTMRLVQFVKESEPGSGAGGGKLRVLESNEESRLRVFQRDLLGFMES